MASNSITIEWNDQLGVSLDQLDRKISKRLESIVKHRARFAEGWARKNAPWTDRTGNARSGLFTRTEINPGTSYTIILSHTVPYGIWLEVRWDAKYAIIMPTLKRTERSINKFLQTMLSRLG